MRARPSYFMSHFFTASVRSVGARTLRLRVVGDRMFCPAFERTSRITASQSHELGYGSTCGAPALDPIASLLVTIVQRPLARFHAHFRL